MRHAEAPEVPRRRWNGQRSRSLVPADHLRRKIDGAVDLDLVRERVRHLYREDKGRPAPDPVALFKLLLLGVSGSAVMRVLPCNVAFPWYAAEANRQDADAPTRSRNRRPRLRRQKMHAHLYVRMRALVKLREQCLLLAAMAENIKKSRCFSTAWPNLPL